MEATTNRTSRERLAEWRLAQEELWAEIERYCDLVAETMADTFYGPYDAA